MAQQLSVVAPRSTTLAQSWHCTHRPVVLVADADPGVRDALAGGLGQAGIEVLEARSGAELEKHLQPASWHPERSSSTPDLIVLGDLPPSGLGGMEALRRLRVVDRATPVVFLSAADGPRASFEATRLGVAAFLNRPVDPAELEVLIACLVEDSSARARRDVV